MASNKNEAQQEARSAIDEMVAHIVKAFVDVAEGKTDARSLTFTVSRDAEGSIGVDLQVSEGAE